VLRRWLPSVVVPVEYTTLTRCVNSRFDELGENAKKNATKAQRGREKTLPSYLFPHFAVDARQGYYDPRSAESILHWVNKRRQAQGMGPVGQNSGELTCTL